MSLFLMLMFNFLNVNCLEFLLNEKFTNIMRHLISGASLTSAVIMFPRYGNSLIWSNLCLSKNKSAIIVCGFFAQINILIFFFIYLNTNTRQICYVRETNKNNKS